MEGSRVGRLLGRPTLPEGVGGNWKGNDSGTRFLVPTDPSISISRVLSRRLYTPESGLLW